MNVDHGFFHGQYWYMKSCDNFSTTLYLSYYVLMGKSTSHHSGIGNGVFNHEKIPHNTTRQYTKKTNTRTNIFLTVSTIIIVIFFIFFSIKIMKKTIRLHFHQNPNFVHNLNFAIKIILRVNTSTDFLYLKPQTFRVQNTQNFLITQFLLGNTFSKTAKATIPNSFN